MDSVLRTIRLPDDLLGAIDRLAAQFGLNRSEAIRRLTDLGLTLEEAEAKGTDKASIDAMGSRLVAEFGQAPSGLDLRRRPAAVGVIYYIRCSTSGDSRIKIGFTANSPQKRIAQLSTGNPFTLELVLSHPGSIDDEHRLHERFSEYRVEGRSEWFHERGEIADHIVRCSKGWEP